MDDDQNLNADAIYAAMAWLRDYAESPEWQAAFRDLLEEKSAKAEALRAMGHAIRRAVGERASVYLRPVFDISDATKEEIYPGELESVDAGLELARWVLWGAPGFASEKLKDADLNDPSLAALSRFISDRAN